MMHVREVASWLLSTLAVVAVSGAGGCSIPSPADAADSPESSPVDGAEGLAAFARWPVGGAVDFADLVVGDQVILTAPGKLTYDPATLLPSCACSWTIEPVVAGAFEPADGCTTVYHVLGSGEAVVSISQTCADGMTEVRSQVVTAYLAPAAVTNLAPVADAGADLQVSGGDTVVLDARGSSDPEGGALQYRWAQVGGLGVTLDGFASALSSFEAPEIQAAVDVNLRFRLTVVDAEGAADVETVVVAVAGGSASGGGLVQADAGVDRTVGEGQVVTLSGLGSTGSGASPLVYIWTQVFGTPVSLSATTDPTVTFTSPEVTELGDLLVFRLKVIGGASSDTDDVVVHVLDGGPLDDDGDGADDDDAGDVDPDDPRGDFGDGDPDDAPPGAGVPFALDGVGSTPENTSVVLTLSGGDVDGDDLTFSIVRSPCDGGLATVVPATQQSATVVYTPAAGFRGTDRFSFTSSDGEFVSAPAVFTIAVGDPRPFRGVFGGINVEVLENGTIGAWIEDGMRNFGIKMHSMRAPLTDFYRDRLKLFAEPVAEVGGKLWLLFNWYSAPEETWLPNTEPYVSDAGITYPHAPCPRSDAIWNDGVIPRFLALVNLTDPISPEYLPEVAPHIGGIILDPELYASDVLANYPSACHCANCFAAFFQQLGITDPVPPASQRADYLASVGLVFAYDEFERTDVAARGALVRQVVHSVNPCMKIGGTSIVRFDRSPFYPGMTEGLGSREAPLYEFSQSTFVIGFSDGVAGLQQNIAAAGLNVELNLGLWLQTVPPDAVVDQYYTMATQTSGVFINGTSYYDDLAAFLCHPVSEYRQAVSAGNAEVDVYEADPNYVSPFTGDPFVPACVNTFPYGFPSGLVPMEAGPVAPVGATIRDETVYYFYAEAGETMSFDVYLREFGSNDPGGGWWVLLSPSGVTLDGDGFTEASSPSLVRVTAGEAGVYGLVVRPSFVHGFHIDNASHPGAYVDEIQDDTVALFRPYSLQPEPQFFAYVPAGVTSVSIAVSADSGEPTEILIHDERDASNALFDQIIGDVPGGETMSASFVLPLGNDAGGEGVVLEISFRNPGGGDDVNFGFSSGALPYLSQTRSGLFRAP